MREIIASGYIGIYAPDLDAWSEFATTMGMQVSSDSTQDKLLLRMDERTFRISIEKGEATNRRIDYVGWEVRNSVALDQLVARLNEAGVPTQEEPGLASERKVDRLVRCLDPGGNQLELYVGGHIVKEQFISPTGTRFVTSHNGRGDLGLGHVLTWFDDFDKAWHFYYDLLKFRHTDTSSFANNRWVFMGVNGRHHSLAFGEIKGAPTAFDHIAIQVETVDMMGLAYDRYIEMDAPIAATIGKHDIDDMLSFYVRSPTGLELECGWGGRVVDEDTWVSSTTETGSLWGHKRLLDYNQ